MKKLIIIILGLFSLAQAQDSSKLKKNRIKQFSIWVNGQTASADDIDIICVEDDLKSYANFRYIITDSTGNNLAYGFVKIEGAEYNDYSLKPNHNIRAVEIVFRRLNLQARTTKVP